MFCNSTFFNELTPDYRADGQSQARILSLIIHYELGHHDLLPYLIRSTYRALKKRSILYKTERVILLFIRDKLPAANSKNKFLKFFKKFKIELKEITKDPNEAKVLEYFDFISWLESKISNRSFADVVREKAKPVKE